MEAFFACVASGEPYQEEYRLAAADGSVHRIRDEDAVVLDPETGKSLRIETLVDVTEDKRLAGNGNEKLVAEVMELLEARGLPAGTWLVDVAQARHGLKAADGTLRRLHDALVREAGRHRPV